MLYFALVSTLDTGLAAPGHSLTACSVALFELLQRLQNQKWPPGDPKMAIRGHSFMTSAFFWPFLPPPLPHQQMSDICGSPLIFLTFD